MERIKIHWKFCVVCILCGTNIRKQQTRTSFYFVYESNSLPILVIFVICKQSSKHNGASSDETKVYGKKKICIQIDPIYKVGLGRFIRTKCSALECRSKLELFSQSSDHNSGWFCQFQKRHSQLYLLIFEGGPKIISTP